MTSSSDNRAERTVKDAVRVCEVYFSWTREMGA